MPRFFFQTPFGNLEHLPSQKIDDHTHRSTMRMILSSTSPALMSALSSLSFLLLTTAINFLPSCQTAAAFVAGGGGSLFHRMPTPTIRTTFTSTSSSSSLHQASVADDAATSTPAAPAAAAAADLLGSTTVSKENYDIVSVDLDDGRDYPIYIGTGYSEDEGTYVRKLLVLKDICLCLTVHHNSLLSSSNCSLFLSFFI